MSTHMHRTPHSLPRRHLVVRKSLRGFSMIEVLVVIVLFSFGLIGLVGLQARAIQTSVSAEDSNRAALLANDIASAMWAARNVNLPTATVSDWNTIVADPTGRGLPNGAGTVSVTANVATIAVTWRAPHEPATTEHNYTTQVVIP